MAEKIQRLLDLVQQLVSLQQQGTLRERNQVKTAEAVRQIKKADATGQSIQKKESRPPKSSERYQKAAPPERHQQYALPKRPGAAMRSSRPPISPLLPSIQAPKVVTKQRLRSLKNHPKSRAARRPKQPPSRWRATENLLGSAGGFVPALGELAGFMRKLREVGEAFGSFIQAVAPRSMPSLPANTGGATPPPVTAPPPSGPKPSKSRSPSSPQPPAPSALPAQPPSSPQPPAPKPTAAPKTRPAAAAPQPKPSVPASAPTAAATSSPASAPKPIPQAKIVPPIPPPVTAPPPLPTAKPSLPPATAASAAPASKTVPPFFSGDLLYQTPQAATQRTVGRALEAGLSSGQAHQARAQADEFYRKHTRNRHARLQAELLRGKEMGLSDEESMRRGKANVEDYLSKRSRKTQLPKSAGNPLLAGSSNEIGEGKAARLLEGMIRILEQIRDQSVKRDTGQMWSGMEKGQRQQQLMPGPVGNGSQPQGGLGQTIEGLLKDAALAWARAAI